MLEVDDPVAALGPCYAREVRWAQGFRVNADSRLLLLGLRRLLARRIVCEAELRTAAFVLGCRLGAMDSYERFDDGLVQGRVAPLAFAYALPSMPLACASVCHSLRGLTYTLTGEGDAGIRALRQAATLIASGATDVAVAGCWETPSATAGSSASCRLLLVVVDAAGAGGPSILLDEDVAAGQDTVAALKHFLAHHGIASAEKAAHG
ncbi:MAG: hypothetical protein ACYC0T_10830 [Ramlibacter sp.]